MDYMKKAIHCVKDTVLPVQRMQFEECGCDLDSQYKKVWQYRCIYSKNN